MSAMLEQMPLTPAAIIDLVAGAIDARVAPHVVASRPISSSEKEKAMLTNMMKRCAAGPALSVRDQWIGAWVMLGSCLLFSVAYVWAAYRYRGNDLVDAFGIMAFPAALLISMPFTYVKGHSRITQAIIVGGSLAILAAISYLTTLI
jgi:drug/metabolite transporter (DMT)-like permease